MRTVTTTTNVYQFAELSDNAKEKARDWWRGAGGVDTDGIDELPLEIARMLGFDESAALYWCVSYCQGDQATMSGRWRASLVQGGKACAELPKDEDLRPVAEAFESIAARWPNAYALTSERYAVSEGEPADEYTDAEYLEFERALSGAIKALNVWAYDRLREDVDWLHSNEHIDECIEGNEYEFTEAGKRCELPESEPCAAPVQVVIITDGGVIDRVLVGDASVRALVVDYDDNAADDTTLLLIPQDSGKAIEAAAYTPGLVVDPTAIAELFRITDERDAGQSVTHNDY